MEGQCVAVACHAKVYMHQRCSLVGIRTCETGTKQKNGMQYMQYTDGKYAGNATDDIRKCIKLTFGKKMHLRMGQEQGDSYPT